MYDFLLCCENAAAGCAAVNLPSAMEFRHMYAEIPRKIVAYEQLHYNIFKKWCKQFMNDKSVNI